MNADKNKLLISVYLRSSAAINELALDRDGAQIADGDDAIDHAVEDGLIGLHDVVAVDILGNAVDGLAGGRGQHGVEDFAHAEDFAGVDIDIGGLSGQALHGWLVNHDARIGQAEALALGALGEQDGRHGGRLADADGDDIGPDEGHGVENRQAGGDGAAGRINVDRNILFRVFRFEEQQLSDDQIGDLVVDRSPQENDVLFQQPGIDVVRAFPTGSLFDHHGDKDRVSHSYLRSM